MGSVTSSVTSTPCRLGRPRSTTAQLTHAETTSYSYSWASTGELQDPLLDGGVEGEQDAEATYVKDLIEITTLYPNPASTQAVLTVEAKEDVSAKVQIFTMDGALVQQVFDGQLYEGWPTTLELDVNSLESGLYQSE